MLVLIGLWSGIGFCVVVYLAALQDIPRELVEAASIDGARRWGVFRHVVLPALTPVTIFLLVWQTFQALQLFDLVFVTTRGGPLQSTTVVVLYVWQQAFQFFNAGYGAAAAYVLAFGAARGGAGVGLCTSGGGRRGFGMRSGAFSPWHLVLAPMALIFALPLLWLTGLVVHDQRADQPLPADDHPRRAAPRRLPLRVPDRRLRPLVPELDDRRASSTVASNLVFCSFAGYAFARMRFRGSKIAARADAGDARDPVPADDDPDVPADEEARADRHRWAR